MTNFKPLIYLAPMAGFGDNAFRIMCKKGGADVLVSEMISAKAVTFGDKKTKALASFTEEQRPFILQIFGSEPEIMAQAAKTLAEEYSPDGIDINMGCPVSKIVKNREGSALMQKPQLIYEIVSRVCDAIKVPVSVKIRKGYDRPNAVEAALAAQRGGASFVAVHGRTREQFYSGNVDLDIIRDVKSALNIPVVGNGDIRSAEDAERMLTYTGCDHIMIGRAALGKPYIFNEIKGIIKDYDIKQLMYEHLSLALTFKPERQAIVEARGHIAHYIKAKPGSAAIRAKVNAANSKEEIFKIINSCEF